VCFGFEPKASVDFAFLRGGSGAPLVVRERDEASVSVPAGPPLLEWNVPGPEPLHTRLYGGRPRFDLWIEGGGWFGIDTDQPAIDIPAASEATRREERLWGLPALLCFWARGDLALHAAAVDVGGGAVLLGAPGRFGKTTLAASFLVAGHRVLTEDLSCCRLGSDPVLLPGPALLKVRHDAFAHLDLGDVPVAAVDRERVHLSTASRDPGDGRPVPIRGICLINEVPGPEVTFDRIAPADAVQELWVLAFNLPTDADRTRCFGDLVALTSSVPVWRLNRPFSYDSLPRVVASVRDAFGG
jgi:hypothetical protein